MGWPEVKKINSDFLNEPLNFNNYINDISMFGKYSYVLNPENSNLWRELITQSLTMFGHSAIHETVYERLTDGDVDYMIRHNGRLGQSFNSFYDSSAFSSGVINSVLKDITADSYNILEIKLQHGINRYISEMTSGDTAGEWLGTVFDVSELKAKTTMASIVSDSTLWNNTIMANESLRYVVCLSAATIDWFANNDSDAYIAFITEVCNSTKATMDLFTALNGIGAEKLTTFMETESVVTVMASKRDSMVAVTYMTEPFAAMIASETAMTIVAASETAVDVIIESMTNAANSETVLDGIKEDLTSIKDALSSIANTETVIAEVADVKENISNVVTSLQKVTSQADILSENIYNLTQSSTALMALLTNDTSGERVIYLPAIINGICKHNDIAELVSSKYELDADAIYNVVSTSGYFSKVSTTSLSYEKNSNNVYSGHNKVFDEPNAAVIFFSAMACSGSNAFGISVSGKLYNAFGKQLGAVGAGANSNNTSASNSITISAVSFRNASLSVSGTGGNTHLQASAAVRDGAYYAAV